MQKFALSAILIVTVQLAVEAIVDAQQPKKVPRILLTRPERSGDPEGRANVDAFRQGMRELGYTEGNSFNLEILWLEGQPERAPERIAEALRRNVDVIVTSGTATTRAA